VRFPPDPPSVDRLLLDTHIFLWWQQGGRLTPRVERAIAVAERVHVSVATAWELAIKAGIGKLRVRESFAEAVAENRFGVVPITLEHVSLVAGMPLHHRDPFDRMLAAQALHEGLTLVTHDRMFEPYALPVLWA
jgi:PIN domain nuclease of toxin-antitoxin system